MKVKEFATVVNGATPSSSHPEYYDGNIIWFTPKDLSDQGTKYVSKGERTITKEGYSSCSTKMLPAGSVLMSSRAPIGLLAISTVECCTNQGFKSFIVDTTKCSAEFLYYYLKYHIKEVEALGSGTTFKEVSKESIEEYEVDLPELSAQKKIVKVLADIDSKIALNNFICSDLEAMAKTIYDYWFVQFDFPNEEGKPYKSSGGKMVWNEELKREIPEGWGVSLLKDKYRIERGLSYTSKDIESGTGVPMLNLACISIDRNYRDGELKYHSGKVTDKAFVNAGDLMIACTDLTREREIIGCPILVPDDGNVYTYSMDLARISFPDTSLNENYMYMTLRTDFYHDYIKAWASGTTVLHLNLEGLDWYRISIPPMNLQEKMSDIVKYTHSKKSEILAENRDLTSLRDFLLPMLMNGQVKIGKEGA